MTRPAWSSEEWWREVPKRGTREFREGWHTDLAELSPSERALVYFEDAQGRSRDWAGDLDNLLQSLSRAQKSLLQQNVESLCAEIERGEAITDAKGAWAGAARTPPPAALIEVPVQVVDKARDMRVRAYFGDPRGNQDGAYLALLLHAKTSTRQQDQKMDIALDRQAVHVARGQAA